MRHDWIFDVLSDLQDYAVANGLTDLASRVAAALEAARREVAADERTAAEDRDRVASPPTH